MHANKKQWELVPKLMLLFLVLTDPRPHSSELIAKIIYK